MAITFVGSHVGTHAATTAQTVNFSSLLDAGGATPTLLQGDYVLVAVENASTVNRTQAQLTPSGYSALHTDDYQNDSNDSNFQVSGKFMGATPDTSVAIPASNATTAGVAYAIFVFRGVNATTPMDVTPVVVGGINTGKADAPAITPTTPGAWIVATGGAAVAAGAVFTNAGDLSATTNHFRSATITTTTVDANVCMGIKTDWVSGAFDPTVFGGSTTTNTGSWSAVTLALRPILDPVTGSLAATETGADGFDASGTVADPAITGALAAQETGADTAAMAGTVGTAAATGSLAAVESGADTAAVSGLVAVSGVLAVAEAGSDIPALSGSVAVAGAFAASEAGTDAASLSGVVLIGGSLAAQEAGTDAFAGAGAVPLSGSLAAVEAGADSFAANGTVATVGIIGALAAVESRDAAAFAGFLGVTQDYLRAWARFHAGARLARG